MDHCLQQISSEVPIVLPVMLRGKLSLLRCRAKSFPGSGTLRCEEKLSKDTARAQHKPGWAAGERSEVKGVRDKRNQQLREEKMPKERSYRGPGRAGGRGGHRNSSSTAQTRLKGAAGAVGGGWMGVWGSQVRATHP